jgi:hypothetical protein
VPSTRIVVWLEHAGQESTQIGFADLNSGLLLAQCVAQVNGINFTCTSYPRNSD